MSEEENRIACEKIRQLEETSPVYVSIEAIATFYRAEEHHQHFFRKSRARIAEVNEQR
jgi:peptide methionine sulfoxide reductase MsrA